MPEWVPYASAADWHQTVRALVQLWREVGYLGILASGPIPWMANEDWIHPPTTWDPRHPQQGRWLFTSDLNLNASSETLPMETRIWVGDQDPLLEERFLWILTPVFGAVAIQGSHPHTGQPGMMVSFEPEAVEGIWQSLRQRIPHPHQVDDWDRVIQSFPPQVPHYRVLAHYSTLLLLAARADTTHAAQLPAPQGVLPTLEGSPPPSPKDPKPEPATPTSPTSSPEAKLLRALVHEINTPLSTILTRTRLALKQPSLGSRTQEHLRKIEQECLEQIERFKLFFQATDTDPKHLKLEPTALVDILKEKRPRWQEQVQRRGSQLDVDIPSDLPNVVSDPQRLDTILSGIIDRIARISPPGSQIHLQVVSAGEQVKLQLQVKSGDGIPTSPSEQGSMQAIGQILVLQPETGAISLSIPMTQLLFRALGGYFTVRHRAQQGDIFTIYLPRHL